RDTPPPAARPRGPPRGAAGAGRRPPPPPPPPPPAVLQRPDAEPRPTPRTSPREDKLRQWDGIALAIFPWGIRRIAYAAGHLA
ncbi:hypothetical protein AAHZ94_27835, partial [Streptomyces sp. HSW2009]